MRLMLWSLDLYHRPATFLVPADYCSRLGVDMNFDELSRVYLAKTTEIRCRYLPISGTMQPENIPGFRAPHVCTVLPQNKLVTAASISTERGNFAIAPLLTAINFGGSGGHEFCLQVVPILTGYLTNKEQRRMHHIPFQNHDIAVYAAEIIELSFAVYGFNSRHFTSRKGASAFKVALAADTRPCGRAMFKQFADCPVIADLANNLLNLITSSKIASVLHG